MRQIKLLSVELKGNWYVLGRRTERVGPGMTDRPFKDCELSYLPEFRMVLVNQPELYNKNIEAAELRNVKLINNLIPLEAIASMIPVDFSDWESAEKEESTEPEKRGPGRPPKDKS